MNKKLEQQQFIVESDESGLRLDLFVVEKFKLNRSQAQKAIKNGEIQINGSITRSKEALKQNDIVAFLQNVKEKIEVEIPVVYEDEYLFVIDKPAGINVHPAAGETKETVVDYFSDKISGEGDKKGVVHRLDKGTSGLMILAKDDETKEQLQKEFKNRKVSKKYLALIDGSIEPSEGTIDMPIGRDLLNRQKMTVLEGGKEAITTYKTLEKYGQFSLVELSPKTGRTHQIRTHLAAIGYPIVGDSRYGGVPKVAPRIFLHAKELAFTHPKTKEKLTFEADLPRDLKTVLDRFQ